jgi:peptidoglycan hydrolase-like protein with peptidoglycan-binding domain
MHSRGSALAAAAGLFILSAGAIAQQAGRDAGAGPGGETIATAQRALGVEADGVVGPRTRSATKRFQRANGLTVDGIIGPQTLRALGMNPGTVQAQAASTDVVLKRIAQCESAGEPTAVSASGRYRGKYQFDRPTWRSIGGTGDPAAALEADQDALAAKLLAREGTSPWPRCG